MKKAQEEEMLMAARTEQVRCKEHFPSIEAGREKAEFERVLRLETALKRFFTSSSL